MVLASTLTVISGFGFVLFCAPLLSLIFDPRDVVVVSLALGTLLLGLVFLSSDIVKAVELRLVFGLVASSILGMPIGILVLPLIDQDRTLFRVALGVLALAFVISRVMRWHLHFPETRLGTALAGLLGGVFSTSTGFSALPVIWFVGGQSLSHAKHRATLAGYVLMNGVLSMVAFQIGGDLHAFDAATLLSLIPAMLIGLVVGIGLVRRLSEKQLRRTSLAYLAVVGILAIVTSGV